MAISVGYLEMVVKALDILDLDKLNNLWIAGESIPLSSPSTNHKSCFSTTNNVTSVIASTLDGGDWLRIFTKERVSYVAPLLELLFNKIDSPK